MEEMQRIENETMRPFYELMELMQKYGKTANDVEYIICRDWRSHINWHPSDDEITYYEIDKDVIFKPENADRNGDDTKRLMGDLCDIQIVGDDWWIECWYEGEIDKYFWEYFRKPDRPKVKNESAYMEILLDQYDPYRGYLIKEN